jgi:hypothetical protein
MGLRESLPLGDCSRNAGSTTQCFSSDACKECPTDFSLLMLPCHYCGRHLVRVHRTAFEKIMWSEMYECPNCRRRAGSFHRSLYAHCRFLFSRHSRCVRCGSEVVQRLRKRDKLERFSRNPLALIQALTGAPINFCALCRLQFFDWRKPRTSPLRKGRSQRQQHIVEHGC